MSFFDTNLAPYPPEGHAAEVPPLAWPGAKMILAIKTHTMTMAIEVHEMAMEILKHEMTLEIDEEI